jgi:hypothetical protein
MAKKRVQKTIPLYSANPGAAPVGSGLKLPRTPPAGRGTGRDGRRGGSDTTVANQSANDLDGKLVVQRRHVDWVEHQIGWRWLLDSFEGGARYRNAVYGPDRRGLPARNLFRHKFEYPDPQMNPAVYQGFAGFLGSVNAQTMDVGYGPYPGQIGADPAATAQDDDYEYRRSRTPVPEFVAEAVGIHLSKVYSGEVRREGPADLVAWWKDVDGRGTPIDDYMRETIAPLLLVLGCLDVCLDHPKAPPGETIRTRADELRLGLDRVVASYILPENMVWWRLDAAGRYLECLVREYIDPSDRSDVDKQGNAINPEDPGNIGQAWRRNYVRWRLWRPDESILFSYDGDEILERVPHSFGCVPIVRLVDFPKHRTPHIGKSRYESIAQYQREYYNRDSELILSDTLQAHPMLSGAEDFCKSDNTVAVGPGNILPKKKNPEGNGYEGWEFISPPKDPAESLRRNKQDIIDLKDRRAALTKPAGAAGGGNGTTVSQSGISKQLDAVDGHSLLAEIGKSLAKAERFLGEYAVITLRNGPIDRETREQIKVTYPQQFSLMSLDDLCKACAQLQAIIANAGGAPEVEIELAQKIVRQALPGYSDEDYRVLDAEIEQVIRAKAQVAEQSAEDLIPGARSTAEAMEGEGSAEQAAGADPTGQSGGTMVSNMIPTVM